MKYPKTKKSAFIKTQDGVCRQVNLHKGDVFNYWFIQPSEKPIKLRRGEIPELMIGADLSDLGAI